MALRTREIILYHVGFTQILIISLRRSGKLPFTIAKSQSDYNTAIELITVDYNEKLNIDYRHFDSGQYGSLSGFCTRN